MKKSILIALSFLIALAIIIISIFVTDKELVNKITIFLSALLSLLISYIIGFTKRKNGLVYGILIGISIATISLIIHFIFAKELFSLLHIRSLIVILGGASGGVMGVNKKYPLN